MTEKAKELLIKLVLDFDSTQKNSFDSMDYIGYSDTVINELADLGCIVAQNDIVGTIQLTSFGYSQSKK